MISINTCYLIVSKYMTVSIHTCDVWKVVQHQCVRFWFSEVLYFIFALYLTYTKFVTLFKIGFAIPEIKTPVPPNAGNEIQSWLANLISWEVNL